MLVAPYSGARGTDRERELAVDSWQQEPITGPCCIPAGGMFAVISATPISCIAGIGIQQAERAAACDTNIMIASAIDTNLDRSAMLFESYSSPKSLSVIRITALCKRPHNIPSEGILHGMRVPQQEKMTCDQLGVAP